MDDTRDKFTIVYVQWHGSTHVSRIWKMSAICAAMLLNTQRALHPADEGYGIEHSLVSP